MIKVCFLALSIALTYTFAQAPKAEFIEIQMSESYTCEIDSAERLLNGKTLRVFTPAMGVVVPLEHSRVVGDALILMPQILDGADGIRNATMDLKTGTTTLEFKIKGKPFLELNVEKESGEFINRAFGKLKKCRQNN